MRGLAGGSEADRILRTSGVCERVCESVPVVLSPFRCFAAIFGIACVFALVAKVVAVADESDEVRPAGEGVCAYGKLELDV